MLCSHVVTAAASVSISKHRDRCASLFAISYVNTGSMVFAWVTPGTARGRVPRKTVEARDRKDEED